MNGEWKYVGEGGKHALFDNASLPGKLLRIDKEHIRKADCETDPPTAVSGTTESLITVRYLKLIVAPFLVPYVDIPEVVVLTWGMLRRLRRNTVEAGVIPQSRGHDWEPLCHDSPSSSAIAQPVGLLVVDYRRFPPSLAPSNRASPPEKVCVELKPKAGYLSWSPLILPRHRAKFSKSRFSLLQILHQEGLVEKGWAKTSEGIRKSEYEPLDLFSGDVDRMAKALKHLMVTPQNNFRIWYNDRSMTHIGNFNAASINFPSEDVAGVDDSAFCDSQVVALVTGLLLPTLKRASLMAKLLALQKLDILDADGATLVSERLVELCDGSRPTAERCVSAWTPRSDHRGTIHPLFEHSPFQFPDEHATLLELCQSIEEFHAVMTLSYPELPPNNILDEYHVKTTRLLVRLTKDECAFLLANWLLSLAMCDVSIFLAFERLAPSSPSAGPESPQGFVHTNGTASTEMFDVDDGRGIVDLTQPDGSTARFAYFLKLIDCDEKPTRKIWSKKASEAAFANLKIAI
jgi:Inositol-pentakisphosphate 2-kinase